ncbi:MAG: hypothetical protein BMS9Abin36_0944 [Gammaproteobacteria bacterium]|nr:MAG: hypothetical protein BMS9Abin36_0944 [Gammaproteobacteria bacterium]
MNLRAKLFIPLLLFSLLLTVYAQFVWLPDIVRFVKKDHQASLTSHLISVAEGLVPLLLDNQLATVYDNLDSLLEKNTNWKSIRLFNNNGNILYPLDDNIPDSNGELMYGVTVPIRYLDQPLGEVSLIADLSANIDAVSQLQRNFLVVLFIIILAFVSAIAITVDWLIRRPVTLLATASDRVARGDFGTTLPSVRNDEVGKLVQSFTAMRDNIQRYQNELRQEMEKHRDTANALYHEKERVSYHASHDALTGLINRREFEQRAAIAIDGAINHNTEHAILYIDLDQFKVVNDTCGHVAGDELLRQLGPILHRKIRTGDTLARLGGDEFGVLLINCPINQAVIVANNLREAVQDFRFAWEDNIFSIGASIGVVPINETAQNLSNLLSIADSACYTAKDHGRNRVYVYQPDDMEMAKRHGEMQWVSRINRALEENHFLLYCQPIVPIKHVRKREMHYEVLLRMQDEIDGIIPPGAFIPAAERYNLMTAIDKWVIENLFTKLAAFLEVHLKEDLPTICINLSGSSLSEKEFLTYIRIKFKKTKVPPASICFEITETAAIANLTNARHFIDDLKQLGCRFSLDDFGSGLSSFAYLKNLPVNYLKIDGVFVKDIDNDPVDYAMVKSINEIGHVSGMLTIAEFVENDAILAKVKKISVDFAQGYGIGKPLLLDHILDTAPLEEKTS